MGNRRVLTIFLLVLGLVATDVAANAKGGGAGGCGHGSAGNSCSSGISFGSSPASTSGSTSASSSGSGLGSGSSAGLGSRAGSLWGTNVGFGRSNGRLNVDQPAEIQEPPAWHPIGRVKPFLFSGADYIGPSGYPTYVQSFTWPKKTKKHSPVATALTNSVSKDKSFQHKSEHKHKKH